MRKRMNAKFIQEIKDDLEERIKTQPDSRCASPDEVRMAALICQIEALEEIISEVHSWIVCAPLTTSEDMAQNFERICEITKPDF